MWSYYRHVRDPETGRLVMLVQWRWWVCRLCRDAPCRVRGGVCRECRLYFAGRFDDETALDEIHAGELRTVENYPTVGVGFTPLMPQEIQEDRCSTY